jgi:hypothetical protein
MGSSNMQAPSTKEISIHKFQWMFALFEIGDSLELGA